MENPDIDPGYSVSSILIIIADCVLIIEVQLFVQL